MRIIPKFFFFIIKNTQIKKAWKKNIFPNWENYFDYKKRRPIAFESYRNLTVKEKKSNRVHENKKFLGCFSTKSVNKSQFIFTEQNEENDNSHKKSNQFLLVHLWKSGIPAWVRKTLWPIAIGNQLEVLNINVFIFH